MAMADVNVKTISASEIDIEQPRALLGPTSGVVRRPIWIDVIVFAAIGALVYATLNVVYSLAEPRRQSVEIDLSPWALPKYLSYSVFRGFAAYFLALAFTLVYGTIAAHNRRAERIMVPILDILQSIPVLGFLPGLMLSLTAMFPTHNLGAELVSIIAIFTGQVWNMTFSFYHSLKSVPQELRESARLYRFGWLRRFFRVDLAYAAIPLAWNSMVGMAGGWFFLTICEMFRLGDQDFRVPGIGSYVGVAIERNDTRAMIYGIVAMTLTIVIIDRLFWRPIIAWAQRFKVEDTASEAPQSMVLDLLGASRIGWLFEQIGNLIDRAMQRSRTLLTGPAMLTPSRANLARKIIPIALRSLMAVAALAAVALSFFGCWRLIGLIASLTTAEWSGIFGHAGISLTRVMAALLLSTLWTVPVGILIGIKPSICVRLQPVIQVVASFPMPMVYPLALAAMHYMGIDLAYGSVILLMLGTQWYILFNSIAGAMTIPQELKESCNVYRIRGTQRWTKLYLPAVLSSLVTGWIAAAGGAWNATIVAEYVHSGSRVYTTPGLGATITAAAEDKQFDVLAGSVIVMALMVVLVNRFLWRRLFRLASEKFSFSQ